MDWSITAEYVCGGVGSLSSASTSRTTFSSGSRASIYRAGLPDRDAVLFGLALFDASLTRDAISGFRSLDRL